MVWRVCLWNLGSIWRKGLERGALDEVTLDVGTCYGIMS